MLVALTLLLVAVVFVLGLLVGLRIADIEDKKHGYSEYPTSGPPVGFWDKKNGPFLSAPEIPTGKRWDKKSTRYKGQGAES